MLALKIIGIICIVLIALFLLSLVIYFFNLDMKLSVVLFKFMNWWYDKADRKKAKIREKGRQ